jgi:fused signal recognition particle receptor
MAFKWFKKNKSTPSVTPEPRNGQGAAPAACDEVITEKKEAEADIQIRGPQPDLDTAGRTEKSPGAATNAREPGRAEAQEDPSNEKQGFFKRLKRGLSKTRDFLTTDIDELFSGRTKIDDELLEELEELLITADIGVHTAMDLIERISVKAPKIATAEQLKEVLKAEIRSYLESHTPPPQTPQAKPHIIMIVGVNGVGKTTTIGKLAARYTAEGQKVLIAAADTFRAAAVEQLSIWATRAGAEIVRHKDQSDPAAVAYDGIEAALARGVDVVLVDTAGRLHTKVNLMEELKKIQRTIAKKLPEAPHEILLILDATTGQNAIAQAELFNQALGITGIALTKLDGTAKGGIVVSICNTLKIPLKYIGIGEQLEDLQDFDPRRYVDALF